MTQNKDLVADAQTLPEENLSEKKTVESASMLPNRDLSYSFGTGILQTVTAFEAKNQCDIVVCHIRFIPA